MSKPDFKPDGLLVLPHLRVQNANAISSPLTWGFPSPTAFLGFTHALQRRLSSEYGQAFGGVGIVCHGFEAQTFKPNRRQHLVFTQSRNPVYLKRDAGKFISEGTPAAIVEEGHAHLEISLAIAVRGGFDEALEEQLFADAAYETALGMRLAGGSILPPNGPRLPKPHWIPWPDVVADQRKALARLRRRLLPGFALVHRPDLLEERLGKLKGNGSNANLLDALLDITRLNHMPSLPTHEGQEKVEWLLEKRPGWLVPLPIGYAGISPLYAPGEVSSARDSGEPFRFVESLYSLGQWIGPHRLNQLEQLLWHSTTDAEAGLYRCVNRYAETVTASRTETENNAALNTIQGA
ncbi:MAG: type I-F CRISPR-associated protein Csy2 [Gammaproteobacteria bacterium RIFOXYA12_FULL_61_12]|nr:MAG: type I-F CRISPR-associated protein Csy2 [Gammaproteobacteria bacterium RIFOXYA12_FULL_61_12]OGT88450.1 MAG: type I-F CRISPR-associated protein Csy2 [Gammaproteobacteria bacterium RIFOXYD12_FULL_61_37]